MGQSVTIGAARAGRRGLDDLRAWLGASLRRQLIGILVLGLALASAVFLAVLVSLYQQRLASERTAAADQVQQLLHAALENAMLKRDIDGLRGIVERLGQQSEIEGVMILAPSGEVRFADEPSALGRHYDLAGGELCPGCALPPGRALSTSAFTERADGIEILRSVVAVPNREPCQTCHGSVSEHPVNGILVVDYAEGGLRRSALSSALTMSAAGLAVVGLSMLALWLGLERLLLRPLARLSHASRGLAMGNYGSRVGLTGRDELAQLGNRFDHMAARIAGHVRALATNERYLQALLDAIPDGVRVIGPDYRVELANRAFLEQQGLPTEQVVGRPCYASSHNRDTPCETTMVTCPLHEVGADRTSVVCRHRHVRADGSDLFVEISAAAVVLDGDGDGNHRRMIVESIRDLSQDIALGHAHKLSELGMLAAGIAHEIRNPLSSIRVGLQAMQAGSAKVSADVYMELMQEEIDKCIEVTERLLKLSVPSRGHDTLVELDQLVAEVATLLASDAEQRSIAVAIEPLDSLRVIGSDSDLRMLVLNLLQNAFHAMPEGGRLTIRGRAKEGQAWLTVQDTGCGIAPEDIERIFQPFWSRRADRGGAVGTGLGLSICREIVKAHHGRIEVASRPGEGAAFTVWLPLAADA